MRKKTGAKKTVQRALSKPAISLRTASAQRPAPPGELSPKTRAARETVEKAQNARREKAWEKLDKARVEAHEKQRRLQRFRGEDV